MLIEEKALNFPAQYDFLETLLGALGPEWLVDVRKRAIRSFSEFGLPTTRDEEFKYTPFRWIEETAFQHAYGAMVTREEVAKLPLGNTEGPTLVFVNGEFAPELTTEFALPDGVFIGSLEEAYETHGEVIEKYLTKVATFDGKLGSTNDDRLVQLNTAFLGEGAFVYVPKNTVIDLPIHLVFLTKASLGPVAIHPRVLLVVEENAEARVIESSIGMEGISFTNPVTEVVVAENARFEHIKFQHESLESAHTATIAVHQGAGSTYTSNVATFGGKLSRTEINVWIDGSHTETWLNGMSVGKGDQVLDHHTRLDHAKPECNSFEVYKAVLDDQSKGVFNGKIFVYEDAQKTDAKQTNKAILLSPNASIDTKPQLEIFADDVKCTHGATIGQLRDDALFYLRARGIPAKEARSLLVYAFAAEVLEKVTVASVREELEALLFAKLNG